MLNRSGKASPNSVCLELLVEPITQMYGPERQTQRQHNSPLMEDEITIYYCVFPKIIPSQSALALMCLLEQKTQHHISSYHVSDPVLQ